MCQQLHLLASVTHRSWHWPGSSDQLSPCHIQTLYLALLFRCIIHWTMYVWQHHPDPGCPSVTTPAPVCPSVPAWSPLHWQCHPPPDPPVALSSCLSHMHLPANVYCLLSNFCYNFSKFPIVTPTQQTLHICSTVYNFKLHTILPWWFVDISHPNRFHI